MAWRACLVAVLLASCFIKPDPPGARGDGGPTSGGDGASSDAGGDAPAGDGSIMHTCAVTPVHEQFTGMTLSNCGAWATTSGAVMAMGGSPLILMTVGAAATECTSKTIGSGAFINVATIPMTPGDTLFLTATLDSSQEITLQLRVGASALIFELLGPNTTISANYSMSNTWWRLSSEGPSALVGESSTDGVTWAKLGTQPTGNSPSDELRMKFGLRTGASGGSGAIADYDQCQ